MASAIDLTNPKLTDSEANYTAEVLLAIQLLAALLDPTYATPANQPAGTKRFNSSTGLLEQWSGSAWNALAVSYLLTTSSGTQNVSGVVNFTGTLELGGSAVATSSSLTSALVNYAALASPNFSGTPSISGAAIATQSWVNANYATLGDLSGYATSSSLSGYATTSGGGASGVWNISIYGSAASATNCTSASNAASLSAQSVGGIGCCMLISTIYPSGPNQSPNNLPGTWQHLGVAFTPSSGGSVQNWVRTA